MANLSNINNILRTDSLGVGINRDPLGVLEVSSATRSGIKMFNTGASGRTYETYVDASGNYIIYDEDASRNDLVINSSGNATFIGNIASVTANFSDNVFLSGGQLYLGAGNSSTDDSYRMYATSGQFVLASRKSGTWTTYFDINSSGNSTFAGNVTLNQYLEISSTTAQYAYMNFGASAGYGWQIGKAPATGGVVDDQGFYLYNLNTGYQGVNLAVLKSGNVGIGTTSPTGNLTVQSIVNINDGSNFTNKIAPLVIGDINGVSNSRVLLLDSNQIESNGDSLYLNYNSAQDVILGIGGGNVGIGTTSPDYKLEVESTAVAYLFSETTGAGGSSGFKWKTPDSEFSWYSSGGTNNMNLYDYTANAIRLTVNSSGNVGIGTDSPSANLNVVGPGDANDPVVAIDVTNSSAFNHGLEIFDANLTAGETVLMAIGKAGSTRNTAIFGYIHDADAGNNNLATIGFWGADNKMTVSAGGNVGIGTGTTTAEQKLHVEGRGVFDSGTSSDILQIRNDNGGGVFGMTSNLFALDLASTSNFRIRQGSSVPFYLKSDGKLGIGTTSPQTKLDVHGPTGTRNRSTTGNSSVFETSLYWGASGNATTNVSIDTATVFPPMSNGGFILVEVSASGYGNSGSNGLIFSYITGGYGGHYAALNQPYHPVTIITNTMKAGTCTWYNPNATTIGITVTTTNSQGITGVMRVKVTTSY